MNKPSTESGCRRRKCAKPLVPILCGIALAACGGRQPGGGQGSVACRLADADRPTCSEVEPFNDDMRLVAISKCRESGGTVSSECPTTDLAGVCATETGENHQPWEFGRRTRTYYYQIPGAASGPLDVAQLREDCERVTPRSIPGHWTAGAARRPAP